MPLFPVSKFKKECAIVSAIMPPIARTDRQKVEIGGTRFGWIRSLMAKWLAGDYERYFRHSERFL